jgi:hypothetical protein
MPRDWNENIVIAELGDEPELSEELAATFDRIERAAAPPAAGDPAAPDVLNQGKPGPEGPGGGAPGRAGGLPPHVVLNLAGVTYLNSSHLAALLRMRKRLIEHGRTLVLCSLGDDVWSVMMLTGLDKVFRFAKDPLTALAGLQLADDAR